MSARLGGVEVSGNETRTTVSCAAHGIDGSDRLHWIWHYHSTSAFLGAASGRQPCADRPDYHRLLTRAFRLPADPGSPLRSLWPPPCDSLVTAHRDSILHLLSALWHISAAARRPLHRRYGGSEPRLSAGGRLRLDHSSRPRERDGHDRRGDWSGIRHRPGARWWAGYTGVRCPVLGRGGGGAGECRIGLLLPAGDARAAG